MVPVLKKEVPVFMHAGEIRQIISAVEWANRQNVKIVIVGGYDAWRVADLLKKYEIPVIYEGVNSLPRRRWEDFDTPFKYMLKRADFKAKILCNPHQHKNFILTIGVTVNQPFTI